MDLWDLTRLLFRRWYFALPVLVLTLGGVMLASRTVKPDYSGIGHLQLIPPLRSDVGDPTKPGRVHNPWLDLGLHALGQAAALKVQNGRVVEALVAAGYTGNFTVTVDASTEFFSVQAVGSTPRQASGTVQRVMKMLSEDVTAEQVQFGVLPEDMITTLPLDKGDQVTIVTSKLKRVLVVAAGVGLLTTTGWTIGLDALLRRRVRRRALQAAAPPAAESVIDKPAGGVKLGATIRPKAKPVAHDSSDIGAIPSQRVDSTHQPETADSSNVEAAASPAVASPSESTRRLGKLFRSKSAADDDAEQGAVLESPEVGGGVTLGDVGRKYITVEYHQPAEPKAGADAVDSDRVQDQDAAEESKSILSTDTIVLPLAVSEIDRALSGEKSKRR